MITLSSSDVLVFLTLVTEELNRIDAIQKLLMTHEDRFDEKTVQFLKLQTELEARLGIETGATLKRRL